MSEPVTNVAIEDVLSSIRRLVSDGDRPRQHDGLGTIPMFSHVPAAAPQVNNGEQPTGSADKFVLTPAFRIANAVPARPEAQVGSPVGSNDNVARQDRPGPVPVADARPPTAPESRSALELRIAELEAAVTRQADEWEPDGSEDVPVVDWSAAPMSEGFMFASRSIAGPRTAEVLDLGKAGTRVHPDPDPVIADAVLHIPFRHAAADQTEGQDDPLGSSDGLSDDLDRSEADEFAGTMDAELATYIDDAGVIDEETLRNLVIEIVRQELQGTLGERITRNVRKLVRREIYRVLASKEFE